MNTKDLELRLQEIEGVLHGLMSSVGFLATLAKADPRFESAAQEAVKQMTEVSMSTPFSDYSLEQSAAVMQLLLLQPAPIPPTQGQSAA